MLMTLARNTACSPTGYDAALLPPRNYNTSIGRFTSFDTFDGNTSEPLTLNHYLYASADPVDRIDPSGHGDFSLGSIAVATAGISALGTFSTILLSQYFRGSGSLGGQVASWYTMRGFLNLAIFPQFFTRGDFLVQGGDDVHLGDTGLAEEDTKIFRYEWMLDYARKQGIPADGMWHKVEVADFMDSFAGYMGNQPPPQIQSWWVGRLSALKAKGSYEVKLEANGDGRFRNVGMEWVGEDFTDAHNFIEGWNDDEPWAKLIVEGIVDIFGDKVLGAQYNLYIHFYDDTASSPLYSYQKNWN